MKNKKSGTFFLLISLAVLHLFFNTDLYSFDYSSYSSLLKKYVITGSSLNGIKLNTVDYKGLSRENQDPSSRYNKLLKQLRNFNPASLTGRKNQVAFWINAYNIGAIKMVLDHYPVESIRSFKINIFKNPWKKKILNIGGTLYSLHRIEHLILLNKYRELEAHFAIVCASVSCPEISPVVYTGENLNLLIKSQAVKLFKNSRKGIRIDRKNNTVYISRIFKFDQKNFSRGKSDIIPFILPYITNGNHVEYLKKGKYKIDFLPYNWNLNGN
jgi:hypothetical protein